MERRSFVALAGAALAVPRMLLAQPDTRAHRLLAPAFGLRLRAGAEILAARPSSPLSRGAFSCAHLSARSSFALASGRCNQLSLSGTNSPIFSVQTPGGAAT